MSLFCAAADVMGLAGGGDLLATASAVVEWAGRVAKKHPKLEEALIAGVTAAIGWVAAKIIKKAPKAPTLPEPPAKPVGPGLPESDERDLAAAEGAVATVPKE